MQRVRILAMRKLDPRSREIYRSEAPCHILSVRDSLGRTFQILLARSSLHLHSFSFRFLSDYKLPASKWRKSAYVYKGFARARRLPTEAATRSIAELKLLRG